MEVDVSIDEDEANFDPQDLLGDPARQEISQTSLEIMQLLAECEGGHELFGNIHQGNFIYDNASLVGSSSELSEIFQDDDHHSSGHRLDDILVNSIESLNKSPAKTANGQDNRTQKKRQRKSKESNKKSTKASKSKPKVTRRKNDDKNDTNENKKRKSQVNGTKCTTSENCETREKMSTDTVQNGSSVINSASCSRVEMNSKYEIGEDGTYTCKMCGKKFTSVRFLQIHSTVHRQKVKLVSRSSTDSDLLRSKKKNSPSKTMNFSKGNCVIQKRLGFPSDLKAVVHANAERVVISSQHSQKLTELSQHCERMDFSKVNTGNESKGIGKSEQSVLSELDSLDDKANRNTPQSETLKSLSKHGSKEYLTLSAKKLKTSCQNETDGKISSFKDVKASAKGKNPAISTEQDSGSVCKDARKRKASGKSRADKCAMKRVCLLDRFWEDDEESQTGQNLGKPDSVYLKTVDPNPRTNGGLILLQSFDKDKSQEGCKSGGQTKVRIKRGQLVRSKKSKVKKSSQQKDKELKQIKMGNTGENIQELETFVKENFASAMFPSKENETFDCVTSYSNKDHAQIGYVKDENDRTKTNLDQESMEQSNLQSSHLSAKSCNMKEMHTDNDTDASFRGRVRSDDNFNANFEEKIKMGTVQQDREKMLSNENKGDNSIEKHHIQSSSRQNDITDASKTKCDSCGTDSEEVKVLFSENSKIKDGQIFCDGNLSRDLSDNRMKDGNTEKQTSSQTDNCEDEGCYDDDMDDLSDDRSSDDESEPLVLYQQSCRTLPLCALLNLARSQKLENDLSRKSNEVEQENMMGTATSPVSTGLSDIPSVYGAVTESDESVHARKQEKNNSLPPNIEILSKSMLKSDVEVDSRIQVKCKDHDDTSVPVSSCSVTSSENMMSENLQIDRPKSTNGKEWAPFSSETKTPSSCTDSASSVVAKSTCGTQPVHLVTEPADSPSGSQPVPLLTVPIKSTSGSLPIRLLSEPAKSITSSQPINLLAEEAKSTSGSEPAVLSAEPAISSTCVIESASNSSYKLPKLDKLSKLSDIQQQENTGLSTGRVKSNQPFETAASVALSDGEQRDDNIAEHLESNMNGNGTSAKQELGMKQNEQLPSTGDVEKSCNVSSSDIEVRQSCVHGDIQESLEISTVSDGGISSLKSIQDEHCLEVSRCVVRRLSVSENESDEVITIEKFEEEKEMIKENAKSDDYVDDTLDEHLNDDSYDETEDSSHFQNSSYFPNPSDDTNSMYVSTETKQGFQHIKVPEKLPQNIMSTCNVIGRFADDMVTGITNVMDAEPTSSNSSSGFSRFHDYCARQISYQNFLEWKLGQIEVRDSSLVSGSVCARLLPFQDFQREKFEELLSSGKYLEGITEVDIFKNKQVGAELQEICSRTQNIVVNGIAETVRINMEKLTDTGVENLNTVISEELKTLKQINEQVTTNFERKITENETRRDTKSSNVLNELDISCSHIFHERNLDEKNISNSCAVVAELSKHNNVIISESWQSEIQDTIQVRTDSGNSKRGVCSVTMSANQYESSEDEHEIPINMDLCSRVLPFETNIMHKFSDKTKLLFQEYHKRQQNSPEISDSDKECTEVYIPSVDHQTQTVSSLEGSECSVYEIHMLRSVSPCVNSNDDQNFKINSQNSETHLSFTEVTSEEGAWSTENMENAKDLVSISSKGCNDSLSSNPEIASRSDIVPFKSRMNFFNFEDISTPVLNPRKIPLSEHDQQYLKSPKKLWYRNYMGGISTMEEKRGDNPQQSETDQTHFIFPEFDNSEQHKNNDVHELKDLDTNTCEKENTQEKTLPEESNDCSRSNEFSRQSCDVIRNSEESQTSFTKILSDSEHFSDMSVRFGICSRMRQFRKRRSCARTCRDGYQRGCARSRAFTQKN
ncbi:uncharacterized protein [Argopecten irradians]|uniref:uncharacterized protein n=1 Tax=Argopecten irradians TaxID=31199 RepID=UPI0037199F54